MAQYKYSVGDRVQVLWEDAVYHAAVITVHGNGAVDVVYTISGSIGLSLTAADMMGEDGNPQEKPEVMKKVKVRVYISRCS